MLAIRVHRDILARPNPLKASWDRLSSGRLATESKLLTRAKLTHNDYSVASLPKTPFLRKVGRSIDESESLFGQNA